MAFLLLLHQKMSLQRKVNKLTLAQSTIGTRKDRITKRIERVQKSYAKKQSNLEARAKQLTSASNSIYANDAAKLQQCSYMTIQEYIYQNRASIEGLGDNATIEEVNTFCSDKNNSTILNNAYQELNTYNSQIAYAASIQKQYVSSVNSYMSDKISVWLEAEKQKLEDEQEEALAPLEEEETLIDIEQASNEAQLTYAKERLQNITQALQQSGQEAPSFGA